MQTRASFGEVFTTITARNPSIMTRLGKPLESPARQEGEHGVERKRLTRYITQRVPSSYQEPQLPTTRGKGGLPLTLMPSTRGTGHPRGDLPVTAPPGGVARGTATHTPHAIAAGPKLSHPIGQGSHLDKFAATRTAMSHAHAMGSYGPAPASPPSTTFTRAAKTSRFSAFVNASASCRDDGMAAPVAAAEPERVSEQV